MATPTSLPAAVATGDVGTAAEFNGLRGAFRILQVGANGTTTQTSSTSSSFVNTALSASITPQSTSSKILVMVSGYGFSSSSGTDTTIRLTRDQPSAPTVLQTGSAVFSANGGALIGCYNFIYLDSPATTSSITYRTQLARGAGTGIAYDEINGSLTTITLMEVSA
jgi:hypothetical protein